MNDITIRGKSIVRELRVLGACALVALGVNLGAIISFNTRWTELVTTLHFTAGIAALIYVVLGLLRLVAGGLRRLWRRGPAG
jgi:hypothetical protein